MVVSKLKYAKTFLSKQNKKNIIISISAIAIASSVVGLSTINGLGSFVEDNKYDTDISNPADVSATDPDISEYSTSITTRMAQPVEETISHVSDTNNSILKMDIDISTDQLMVSGYTVYVDGTFLGSVSKETKKDIEKYVDNTIAGYEDGLTNPKSVLLDKIEYVQGTFTDGQLCEPDEITSEMNLSVKTTYSKSKTSSINFKTVTKESNEVYKGKTKVKTEGEKGKLKKTYSVTTINGIETGNEFVKETVVSEPINKVVLKGTKKYVSAPTNSLPNTNGYIFPLGNASYYVSSTFGYRDFDSSFHKGIDYAASSGTPIYAVSAGKVTYAAYNNHGFGNYVVVDHGNGIVTSYAHMSRINVSAGQAVSAGDMIGEVGTTGDSTGNHLHFTVQFNGEYINPTNILN